ncbi:MAG TPA: hypothetical protein VNH46_04110, partial [Gemmatimonadales bacterium]|nr:hypothetical protein [Gemmatimonadales bacterium]
RYSMGLPPSQAMQQGILGVNLAFSPDGQQLVYVGNGDSGAQLFVRRRDRLDATPLSGTIGAFNPFFSPDGDRIAFMVGGSVLLKVVPAIGGPPITLAEPGPGTGGGGAWGPDSWIYFDSPGGLSRIRADGGTPELIAPLDSAHGETGHAWPDVTPDGKGLIYRSRKGADVNDFEIVALNIESGRRRVLTKGLMARYVSPGYLVYVRADGALLAAPFDQHRLTLTGPAVPLLEGVMTKAFGSSDLAISPTGTLAYVPGSNSASGGGAELVQVGRDGAVHPLDPPVTYNPSANRSLSLSPDGRRVAFDIAGQTSADIYIKQLPSGPLSRLTLETTRNWRPRWTPDGRSVIYIGSSDSNSVSAVWERRADGSAPAEPVWHADQPIMEASLSPDGRWLIYRYRSTGNRDIEGIRLGRDSAPTPLVAGPFNEQGAALSPDGRWLAYMSNESGPDEIYVRPFPNTSTGRWQVSTEGGSAPRWSHSGRELFYQSAGGDLMVVPITPGATFQPGTPRALFSLVTAGLMPSGIVPLYDLTPDDQRFLMVRLAAVNQTPGQGQLVVVDNWITELEQKMRAARH